MGRVHGDSCSLLFLPQYHACNTHPVFSFSFQRTFDALSKKSAIFPK